MANKTPGGLATIGAVIRAWRESCGMTATELAAKAGVRLGYISELEHDKKRRPEEDYLLKLAEALGVSLQDIYGRRMPSEKEVEDGQALKSRQQARSTPVPTTANRAMPRPDKFVSAKAEEIDYLIASGGYSEEEEKEVWAAVTEMIKRFNSFKEAQRKIRKED